MPATSAPKHTPGPWLSGPPTPGAPASATIYPVRGRFPIAEVMLVSDAAVIAAAPDLLAELQAAHRIIRNALNLMTPEQKNAWGLKNQQDAVDGEGVTRANERAAVIKRAGGGS